MREKGMLQSEKERNRRLSGSGEKVNVRENQPCNAGVPNEEARENVLRILRLISTRNIGTSEHGLEHLGKLVELGFVRKPTNADLTDYQITEDGLRFLREYHDLSALSNDAIDSTVRLTSKGSIVAVIPAFNEERTIARLILTLRKHADEVVVCDDGSTDMTSDIAGELGARVIRMNGNAGKGAALRAGLEYARGFGPGVVVTLDADGQHDADDIPALVRPILEGKADMSIGSRYVSGSWSDFPTYRRVGLAVINFMSRRRVRAIKDTQSGLRAYSAQALDVITKTTANGYGVETEQLALAAKHDLKICEVPAAIRYRGLEKTSKKHPMSHGMELIMTALRVIIEDSPLLFLGVPGLVLMLVGVLTGVSLMFLFNATSEFSIPLALVTLGALFTGTMLSVASLIIYAIAQVKRSVNGSKDRLTLDK